MCWLYNIVVKVGLLSVLQKPSSAKEMLIQDVRPEWRIDIVPKGSEPGTEDITKQLRTEYVFLLDRPGQ